MLQILDMNDLIKTTVNLRELNNGIEILSNNKITLSKSINVKAGVAKIIELN